MALLQLLLAAACWGLVLPSALAEAEYNPVSYLEAQPKEPKYSTAEAWANFKPSPNHAEIVAASPDIWQVLPKQLDPQYRNPCWTDSTQRFRCLPYFQIVGVSKCGTTDLYARLKKHPDFADGAKGPHWWDECVYPPRGPCTAPPGGDFSGYVDLFEKGAHQIKARPVMVTGEASSNTFTGVFTYVRGLAAVRGVNVTLAQLIREAQPYARIIVIMREPVSRYYSAFHYYRARPSDPFESADRFHEKAVQNIQQWEGCVSRWGMARCLRKYDPQQLVKGMYSEFVEPWLAAFPKDQILWLRNEDYQRSPRTHLEHVFKFLGLRNLDEGEWSRMLAQKRANSQSTRYPRMLPKTRDMLEAFFRPFNTKLEQLLGDPRWSWNDSRVKVDLAAEGASGATARKLLEQGALPTDDDAL